MPPGADLRVAGPDWLPVRVVAQVVPVSLLDAVNLQAQVKKRLNEYLHPLLGGPEQQGWEFARMPHRSDLVAVVGATPGVLHVRALVVEIDERVAVRVDRFLIQPGDHDIEIVAE